MVNSNVICVIDGAAGSCGKGKVCGEIATNSKYKIGASVTNSMPNAGHTYVDEKGKSYLFQNIPVAIVSPNTELFIGPSSVIDFSLFKEEYDRYEELLGGRKIYVHELVPLIEKRHKMIEKQVIKSGSTYHGCAACNQEKIIRDPKLKFFEGYKDAIVLSNEEWLDKLYSHLDNTCEFVLVESAQGCDLSLNFSGNHPHVTSRNISVSNSLQETGVSPRRLHTAVMVIRPFPIRINDFTNDGKYVYTGAYGSGLPLTWSHLNVSAKCGFYPTSDQAEFLDNYLDDELKLKLLNNSDISILKQIFWDKGLNVTLDDIGIIEALEMERLINKRKGISNYISEVIDLSQYKSPVLTDLSELTSVTRLERKLFDLDIKKLCQNVRLNDPDCLYLNFFQHLDINLAGVSGEYQDIVLNKYIREYINWLDTTTGVDVHVLGTGKVNNECIKKKELIKY